jgi:hypothetical protein
MMILFQYVKVSKPCKRPQSSSSYDHCTCVWSLSIFTCIFFAKTKKETHLSSVCRYWFTIQNVHVSMFAKLLSITFELSNYTSRRGIEPRSPIFYFLFQHIILDKSSANNIFMTARGKFDKFSMVLLFNFHVRVNMYVYDTHIVISLACQIVFKQIICHKT